MASVYILTKPPTDIDYSVIDGRVRSFILRGKKLFDESDGTDIEGWRDELVKLALDQSLNIDYGEGVKAFVYKLSDEGLLEIVIHV